MRNAREMLRPATRSFAVTVLLALAIVAGGSLPAASEAPPFSRWIAALWPHAKAFGIERAVFDKAFQGLQPDLSLPDLVIPGRPPGAEKGQAEFVRPPQDYMKAVYLARLAADGRKLLRKHRAVLDKIEREIGVPPAVVLAIWGRETAFGKYRLPHDAIRALATQAYTGRRKAMFREELLFALRMLQDKVVTRAAFRSSWAGAVGLTQFMPSEYYALAYDLDGDGRRDIWSAPDALASAANQLRKKGWERGKTWGFEVRLPKSVTCALDGPAGARAIKAWAGLGVRRVGKKAFPRGYLGEDAFLFTPGGGFGPAFLVLENFMVFKRYNPSDLYALFVGNLADRIAGAGDFVTGWGDIRQLSTKRIAAIQSHLKAAGFAISKVDGKIGANTRSQIGAYEVSRKLPIGCWPTQQLLETMAKERRARDGG